MAKPIKATHQTTVMKYPPFLPGIPRLLNLATLLALSSTNMASVAHAEGFHAGIRVPYTNQDPLAPAYGTAKNRMPKISPDGDTYLSYFTKARALAVPYLGEGTYTFQLRWTLVADIPVTTVLATQAIATLPITVSKTDLGTTGTTGAKVPGYSPGQSAYYPLYPCNSMANAVGFITAPRWGALPSAAAWRRPAKETTGTAQPQWPSTQGIVTPGYNMGFPPNQIFSVTGTSPVLAGEQGIRYVYPPAAANFSSPALGTMQGWNAPTHTLDFEVVMDSTNTDPEWKYFVCQDYTFDNFQNHLRFYSITGFDIVYFKSTHLTGKILSSPQIIEGSKTTVELQFSIIK